MNKVYSFNKSGERFYVQWTDPFSQIVLNGYYSINSRTRNKLFLFAHACNEPEKRIFGSSQNKSLFLIYIDATTFKKF